MKGRRRGLGGAWNLASQQSLGSPVFRVSRARLARSFDA